MLTSTKTKSQAMIVAVFVSVWMVFPTPVFAELVLCLAFEGDLLDSSGYGNHASVVNDSAVISISEAGVFGNALSIMNVTHQYPSYLRVENSSSISPSSAITLSAWVNPTGPQISSNVGIFFKGNWGWQPDYQLHINDIGTGGTPGPSGACATINGNGYASSEAYVIDYDELQPVPDGLWTHVAATYDGDVLRLYVNGILVDEFPHTDVIDQSGEPLVIGNRWADAYGGGPFRGLMDDLKIFDTALSAQEVCALFCEGAATGIATADLGCACNQPPVAVAGEDQSIHPGTEATLDGSGSSDPDEDYPLTYSWQITSKPGGSTAVLSDSGAVNPSFMADLFGDYMIELVVTDSEGAVSESDSVVISTWNTAPVADAGEDQAIIIPGMTVQLDGTQSWDDDGDPITYSWTLDQKPDGSAAELDDPASATPTFVTDVYGEYAITLVVEDPWVSSEPDSVTVSFENVQPVADAGGNQSVMVGDTVGLDGIASHDDNLDPLTFAWSVVSKPEGSQAQLSDPQAVQPIFVADRAGTYVVSLVVNDGWVDSEPANVTIEAIACADVVALTLRNTIAVVNDLPPGSLKNDNMKNALTNKINAALGKIDAGGCDEALDKLSNDVVAKTNGCAESGTGEPDRNDWLITCEAQGQVYPLLMQAIGLLENGGGPCCP
jgi:hypothetical protein